MKRLLFFRLFSIKKFRVFTKKVVYLHLVFCALMGVKNPCFVI